MRKIVGVCMAMLFLVGSLAGPAEAKRHSMTAPYNFDLTKPGASAWYGDDYGLFFGDTVTLQAPRGHKSVALMIMDDSGDAVSAAVWQDGVPARVLCETAKDIAIKGGEPVFVQVIIDVTPNTGNGCETPALPSTGMVMATFK